MNDFYLEYRDSMGYVLMRLGSFKSYSECRKAVNYYISKTCMDNFYRTFKLYPKPLQVALSTLAKITPGSSRIKVKRMDISNIDISKYHCDISDFFKGSLGGKVLTELGLVA